MLYDKYDRSIYERIRLALVAKNYLPDIALYPDTPTGNADYAAAKAALKETLPGKVITDVKGIGMWRGASTIEPNLIVITRPGEEKGSLGGFPEVGFVQKDDGTFDKIQYPRYNKNLMYEIRLITKHMEWERTLMQLIEEVLGMENYLQMLNPVTLVDINEFYLMEQMTVIDTSSTEFLERTYQYKMKEVFTSEAKVIRTGIVPLTRIDFNIIVQPSIEGSGPDAPTETITVVPDPTP